MHKYTNSKKRGKRLRLAKEWHADDEGWQEVDEEWHADDEGWQGVDEEWHADDVEWQEVDEEWHADDADPCGSANWRGSLLNCGT